MTGSLKPFWAFQAATAFGAAFGPRTTTAGEGKTECSRTKTKIEMPIRITMDVPRRRIRYAVIFAHPPPLPPSLPGSAPTVGQACLTGHVSMAEKNPRQEPLMPPTHEV